MSQNQTIPPLYVRSLTISTRILQLNPQFVEEPSMFARQHGVELVGDIFPATSFRREPETREKTESKKANIHLVQYNAIRLLTKSDGCCQLITSIELDLAVLLHDDEDHPLIESDLVLALSILKSKAAPLLNNPKDVCHIVPGLVNGGNHVACWSAIESEASLPHIHFSCLHSVSHPRAGRVEGASKDEMTLGRFGGDCVIHFKNTGGKPPGKSGEQRVQGIQVRLSLSDSALLERIREVPGKAARVRDKMRVVKFRASDLTSVYMDVMSELEGTYLPVPPEWAGMGKPATAAKIIALLSQVTSIPIDELKAMYSEQSHPSDSTRDRLNEDVLNAVACLKPVPVSSLFLPDADAPWTVGATAPLDADIDPLVAAVYGPNPAL